MPIFSLEELLRDAGARMATDLKQRLIGHPGEAGTDKEEVLRRFLRAHLAKRFEISTGFAFDSAGNVSKQLDVIIANAQCNSCFETVGGTRYYPCEAIVAVGQVRSSVTSGKELLSAFENLESAKALDRTGNGRAVDKTYQETLDHKSNHLHQIFTFLFVTDRSLSVDSIREKLLDYISTREPHLWPNVILALDRYLVTYCCLDGVCPNTMHARGVAGHESADNSELLMRFYLLLGGAIEVTRVSGLPYWDYLRIWREWNAVTWHSAQEIPPPLLSEVFSGIGQR